MFVILFICYFVIVMADGSVFDSSLYEDVIDSEKCDKQLRLMLNESLSLGITCNESLSLGITFLDSSAKVPTGIMSGNLYDLGNYYQCLAIEEVVENMEVRGKFCAILVPLDQIPIKITNVEEFKRDVELNEGIQNLLGAYNLNEELTTRMVSMTKGKIGITLGICVPKVCPPRQAIDFFVDRLIFLNVTYEDSFCRLPNDKPWVAVDFVAIVVFASIGFLNAVSSVYDVHHNFILKKNPSEASSLYSSFSIYKNTRRFLTFSSGREALDCIDGIRAISMLWVIAGHTFVASISSLVQNIPSIGESMKLFSNLWITSAPISVDTFFLLSGILCVYSTIGKIGRNSFIKNIHLFYLHRLLRMTPLLATVVLFQASLANHVSDGPFWNNVAVSVQNCRSYWWSALFYIQNYYNIYNMCLAHTWYLSVDVQLYIFCPLILVWLFRSRKQAFIALGMAALGSLAVTSFYSFMYDYPATFLNTTRIAKLGDYMKYYYMNTLTRAPPFFIGMFCGYLLHVYREKKVNIIKAHYIVLWGLTFILMAFVICSTYPLLQSDYNNQLFDNFYNACMRALWSVALVWLIFACIHGYGGPINWFLSLAMWKLPARLSYAMYLVHFPLIILANSSWVTTHYFTIGETMYRFLSDLSLTMLAAFVLSITLDAPCSTLQKLLLSKAQVSPKPKCLETLEENKQDK